MDDERVVVGVGVVVSVCAEELRQLAAAVFDADPVLAGVRAVRNGVFLGEHHGFQGKASQDR